MDISLFPRNGRTGLSLEDDNRGKTTTVRGGIVVRGRHGPTGKTTGTALFGRVRETRRVQSERRVMCVNGNGIRDEAGRANVSPAVCRKRFRVPWCLQDQTDVIRPIRYPFVRRMGRFRLLAIKRFCQTKMRDVAIATDTAIVRKQCMYIKPAAWEPRLSPPKGIPYSNVFNSGLYDNIF